MSLTTWESFSRSVERLRYRWSLRLLLSELLQKQWFEPAIPFALMVALFVAFSLTIPGYAASDNVQSLARLFAEFGFVALGMGLTLISGGIDLSVGAIFALTNFAALAFFNILELPLWATILATLLAGASVGAVNGLLVGYLKARPFLTTLVTLIILRAVVNILNQAYTTVFATAAVDSDAWDFLGGGSFLGIPVNAAALIVILLIGHLFLSRSRYGWRMTAVGASRKAARHAGIPVELMLFWTYVLSGALCGAGGLFYAARQGSSDSTTGVGWEFQALTAVVLGGVSLGGGKGTVGRAMIGAVIIFLLSNGFVRMGVPGYVSSAVVGAILLIAVGVDVKWSKNRGKAIQKIYVNPTLVELAPAPSLDPATGSPYAENDRLLGAEAIGVDQVEGPEDVILDRQDRLYGSTRDGNIIRFSGVDFGRREVFAHIGGRPYGMAFDRDENLIVCVGGMGLYGVKPDGGVFKLTDETTRTWYKLNDDSRIRMADDLDIAPDGRVFFSDATTRYEATSWALDAMEGRGNGRLLCYDPATRRTQTVLRNIPFPNGVCVAHDGRSFLFASTWLCKIYRYWLEGPKRGQVEIFVENLPGNPDNINRASDGTYWLALVGIRTPTFDLAARMPGFRLRMVKQIPGDEWLSAGVNHGCVVKFNEAGEPLESMWDPSGLSHPTITSMREHKGYLYLGGLENNRIGRIKLAGADPTWTGWESYWGNRRRH